jgi:hypothetical protein
MEPADKQPDDLGVLHAHGLEELVAMEPAAARPDCNDIDDNPVIRVGIAAMGPADSRPDDLQTTAPRQFPI